MKDEVAPSPDKATLWSMPVVVPHWMRIVLLGTCLVIAALLAYRDSPYRSWSKVPSVSVGFAAWSVGFLVLAVTAAVIAGAKARRLGQMNGAAVPFIAISALLLIPLVNGTYVLIDLTSSEIIDERLYYMYLPSPFLIAFVLAGTSVSDLMSPNRWLVSVSASVVGALTVRGLWERRIFDDLNIVVVVVGWVAVIAAVVVVTMWTPDDRQGRETHAKRPPLPAFNPYPMADDDHASSYTPFSQLLEPQREHGSTPSPGRRQRARRGISRD